MSTEEITSFIKYLANSWNVLAIPPKRSRGLPITAVMLIIPVIMLAEVAWLTTFTASTADESDSESNEQYWLKPLDPWYCFHYCQPLP